MRTDPLSGIQHPPVFRKVHRLLSVLFVVLCLVSGFLLSGIVRTGLVIDTDLRALLPETSDHALYHHAEKQLLARLGNTVILLLGAQARGTAVQAGDFARAWLDSQASLQADPESMPDSSPEQLIANLKDYRFHLLTPGQRRLLENGSVEVLVDRGWASVLGLHSWSRIGSLQEDPLALFDGYVNWLSQVGGAASITRHAGYSLISVPQKAGWYFTPLYINPGNDAFRMDTQADTVATLERLQEELGQRFPAVVTLKSGIVFHAAEAAQRARAEVALIGLGSLCGIIALFIMAFRSLIPLLLSLASVIFGCVVAFSFVHAVYTGLHIITLVFGAALIGVSIDYALHYFTRKFSDGISNDRFSSMRVIFPVISLGLVTSVIGYGSLGQAPLPGLRQVALFSVTGLVAAWLFVVVIFPLAGGLRTSRLPASLTRLALFPQRRWQDMDRLHLKPAVILSGLGLVGALVGWLTVTPNDDISVFHTPSRTLLEEERELKEIIDSYAGNQFFIVTGPNEQQVLQNEEVLRQRLEELIDAGVITNYLSISRILPSIARQEADYRLQKLGLYNQSEDGWPGPVNQFMQELGFDDAVTSSLLADFAASEHDYLTPENSRVLEASGLDVLRLGRIGDKFGTVILLQGIEDTASLAVLAERFDGVLFIDNVSELSRILAQQRFSATATLALAYGAVMILLLLYYRRIDAMLLPLVPLTSTLLTIIVLSSIGMPIGLFHLFAMFLILGLGMDYSIFIYASSQEETASHTAVLFSAVTSCLSFGLLTMSSTSMVQYFGATVLVGSLFNLVLAPAISRFSPARHLPGTAVQGS